MADVRGELQVVTARAECGDFAKVYADHHDAVWRTLAALGVPEAALDDGVQEVFVVVHRRMGDPRRFDSMRSWIYAITRRVAWGHHRAHERVRRREAAAPCIPQSGPDPEDLTAQRQAASFLGRFLDTLDHAQRTVFVLAEIEGLAAPEIASIVDAKLPTVYSRLRLARRKLARAVARLQTELRRTS